MRLFSILFLMLLMGNTLLAQPKARDTTRQFGYPIEALGGNRYYSFFNSATKPLAFKNRLYFLNILNMDVNYETGEKNFLVIYSSAQFRFYKIFNIAVGSLYSTHGVSATLSLNCMYARNGFAFGIIPILGLKSEPELLLVTFVQYVSRPLWGQWSSYSRISYYTYQNQKENIRTFEQLRLGLNYKSFQGGFAANIYELGNDFEPEYNLGIFLRKEIY